MFFAAAAIAASAASGCAGSQAGGGAPAAATESAQSQGGLPPAPPSTPSTPVHGYRIVKVYPHDPRAFTQGLVFRDGVFYESTGQVGQSSFRKVEPSTGRILQQVSVAPPHFAEGLAEAGGRFVQLTWQGGVAFVYDRKTLARVTTFEYSGEGWGLAHDGTRFILSDGSPALRFLDTNTFQEIGRVTVRDAGRPVEDLNELEFVRGEILANVWHSNRVARIDPSTGDVRGWIDLAGLLRPGEVTDPEAVLNGIAWDEAADRLFVTGKLWPKVFEIRIDPATGR
jgi:glutamine cyclotransferase